MKINNIFKILAILLLLIVILIVVFIRSCSRPAIKNNAVNAIGNSTGNMANYGIVCEQGNTPYFLNTGTSLGAY